MWREYFRKLPGPIRRAGYHILSPLRMAFWRWTRHPRYFEMADRRTFFRKAFYALRFNAIDGDYCEFGCHTGLTFSLAYGESRRVGLRPHLWAFDSFSGMPEHESDADTHPSWKPGGRLTTVKHFHEICKRNGIDVSDYSVVEGYYQETLSGPNAVSVLPRNIAMAYIDCDLYSSTVQVLNYLSGQLKHGMILAFDDYFCWSSTHVSGERKAFLEFSSEQSEWRFVPYDRFGWAGQSFVVEAV